ncbi:SDR family NAD(P)-dependent oxidoreductase [Halopseudomonas salegens]|uniref:Short-chain dehydrogenase n=1 Tax=Halopseudomonas salegens TaxID=1434072 RepID=A0A1H2H136_9GAMM|nr:SDR family NAD(P)-dependent oxidoreductase [Halopseudomonas salegens]SDU25562.1 Short-chain dehydrogenase [Halopseudomonas salegens]
MSSIRWLASRRSLALLVMSVVACIYLLSVSKPAQADEHVFKDKVAIITGTSYGLGRELALLAAAKEMKLVMVDYRPDPSHELAEQLRSQGVDAIVIEADLAEADQRPQIVERTLEEYGRIDYLFNNAGYSYLATLEEMDVDAAKRLMEVNYWAYADLAQRVIPHMREQGGGTILNVSSILGMRAAPANMGHYAATKHALHGLFQSTAQEVADDNIKVFVAAPAGMRTHISKHSVGPAANPEEDRAANWEDPAIPARDIFDMIQGDDVVFNPGYIGRQ